MNLKKIIDNTLRFLAASAGVFMLQQSQALACSTSAWDDSNKGSVVDAVNAARYDGDCGLRLNLNGTSNGWLRDPSPGSANPAVTEYVARFYTYVDDAQLANGQGFTIFNALDSGSNELFGLELKGSPNGPVLHLYTATKEATSDVSVPTGWRAIILHWTTGSNGALTLSIDNDQNVQTISSLANGGQSIHSVNLGVVDGNNASISGIVDLDSFASRRTGTAGLLISKSCSGTSPTVENATFLGPLSCTASGLLTFGNRVTFDPQADLTIVAGAVAMNPGMAIPVGAILDITIQ